MTKALIYMIFLVVTTTSNSFCQEFKFWGDLKPGKFSVEFQDTIVFKSDETYTDKNYSGGKPFFISFWFPSKQKGDGNYLTYKEYYNPDHSLNLDSFRNTMIEDDKATLIRSGVTNNMDTWETSEFTNNEQNLLDAILNTKVNAHRSTNFPKERYPVIIYHHGAGGTAEENAVLFEFLASNGFVVISCNYEFPMDDAENTYMDIDSSGMPKFYPIPNKEINDIEFVIQFAQSLSFTNSGELYFIGHSRGAQDGLMLNRRGNTTIKAYILFDTTLEGAPVEIVKQIWPAWDSLIREHPNDFKTRTYLISSPKESYFNGKYSRQPDPEFQIFKFLNPTTFTLLSSKRPMHHNSFLSLGVIKKFYSTEFKQPDDKLSAGQVVAYFDLVQLTLSILKTKQIDQKKFTIVK